MGWFEDQLNERKENDEMAFGESFLSLAGIDASEDQISKDTYKFNETEFTGKAGLKEYVKFIIGAIPVKEIIIMAIFGLIATGIGMLVPYFTRKLTGEVIERGDLNYFMLISVFVMSAAIGSLLIGAVQALFNARVSLLLSKNVQSKTIERILHLPASFFKKYNTGELSMRSGRMIGLASVLVEGVFMSLVSAVMSMAYLFQLVGFTPTLIAPTVLIMICTTGFSIFISLIRMKVVKRQLKESSRAAGLTYEVINGIQKIRLSGAEKRVFVKWAEIYARAARLIYKPPKIIIISSSFTLFISLMGNIIIYLTAGQGDISVGDYMAFQACYGILSAAFVSIANVVSSVSMIIPDLNMVSPILEEVPEEEDPNKVTLEKVEGNIKLENISFSYGENLPNVLDDISVDIKSGDYVAIVGKTGCGKSTLVRLLLGFEKPKTGKIYYDGIDMENINLTSVRKNIGTVTQNGTLFHADILSNILITAPSLGEEEAWEAARVANIAKDICEMPMGMHTIISEGQGSISGGQKQRIMIARAIVNKPRILIFDEATSALDNVTQQSISDSINQLSCTRIVIAHRLSTIINADRIIMLEGGRIIEDGSYDELIAKDGKFAELVKRQRLDVEE